jgi:hypothetical protein
MADQSADNNFESPVRSSDDSPKIFFHTSKIEEKNPEKHTPQKDLFGG